MEQILLIGSGTMAIEYHKVLRSLGVSPITIGRGKDSAEIFEKTTGSRPFVGGVEKYILTQKSIPSKAIIAVGVENLASTAEVLIEKGIKKLLIEKPGALTLSQLEHLAAMAKERSVQVYIAYNRRFYSSVIYASEQIKKDGGVLSFTFDFTEWTSKITPLKKAPGIKEHWILGNSSHVIDTAFFLGGRPVEWQGWHSGGNSWHPAGTLFFGAGKTLSGALFSYQANWDAPGRWGIEVCTAYHRFIFKPLEKLEVIERDSVNVIPIKLEDDLDILYKPGIHNMVERFIKNNNEGFCTIDDQVENTKNFYYPIANYID